MKSVFGERLRITMEGESHGPSVSCTVAGFPEGMRIDADALGALLDRRRGGGKLATPRREEDLPIFLSGVRDGVTTGEDICVLIENRNVRSGDYDGYRNTPRPSHADYTALMRYGETVDLRGGGHFSARLTAPLVAVGALCRQWLLSRGISVGAHLESVGNARDLRFSLTDVSEAELQAVLQNELPVLNAAVIPDMIREIEAARAEEDSIGGVVECAVCGMPAGIGSPLGGGLENRLSSAMFVLGGVRGIEFGEGFAAASMRGSEHNDPYAVKDGRIVTETNHAGGIVGGISTGMPIVFRIAMKPTASIGREQRTVSLSDMTSATIAIRGRHDPCIALRAVPCVEAMTAIVLADAMLEIDDERK